MIFIIIAAYAVIIYLDMIPILKNKEKKKFYIYLVFMSFSFTLSILLALGVEFKNHPAEIIKNIVYRFAGR